MILNLEKPENIVLKILWIIFFNLFVIKISAQFYNTGTEPSGVKWKQIESSNYIVIYPEGTENKAREYVMKLEMAYQYINFSAGFKPKKYAYVMHTYSGISNGLTGVAPNKVEVFLKPHQDIYGQNWDEQLILHEGRHIAQFMSMNRGASRFPIMLFGDMAYSFPIGLYVPDWFMEGDAVVTETALSEYGRGRLPGFEKGMRAWFLQRGNPGYDKMMLGSFKDYVPNHYETGYHVVAANRAFRDKDIFKDKLENIARYPWYLWPFSRKSNGLKDTRNFKYYRFAADTLMALWKEQDEAVNAVKPEYEYKSKDYTGLTYLKTEGINLYAYQQNYDNVPRIIKIEKDSKVKQILSLGYSSGKYFDVKGRRIALTMEMPDTRWELLSDNAVFIYNMDNGRLNKITETESYYAPVFHPDKNLIAAVEYSNNNKCSIVLIDIEKKEIIQRLSNPQNHYIITPQWCENGNSLVYIKVTPEGKTICKSDLQREEILFGPTKTDIRHPFISGDELYFSGDWSGLENIYKMPLCGGEPEMITNSRFGAISPVMLNGTLTWLDYTCRGNYVAKSDSLGSAVALSNVQNHSIKLYDKLAQQEAGVVDFTIKDTIQVSGKKYRKFPNQFNFHSLMPFAGLTLNNGIYVPGASFMSQSLLNDATMIVGYNSDILARFWPDLYSRDFDTPQLYLNYVYRGWLPVISFNLNNRWLRKKQHYASWNYYYPGGYDSGGYGGYGSNYSNSNGYTNLDDYYAYYIEEEITLVQGYEIKLELPFSWRSLDCYYGLQPSLNVSANVLWELKGKSSFYGDEGLSKVSLGAGLTSYALKQKAYRDLFSPLGFVFKYQNSVDYSRWNAMDLTKTKGSELFDLDVYLPGLIPHSSFQIYSSYLKLDFPTRWDEMSFASTMPVGWSAISGDLKRKNYRIGAEYFIPVANMDAEIFWLAYLKRMNISFWADYGWFENTYEIEQYNIFGGSLFFDTNAFRYPINMKIGAKVGYSVSHKQPYFNIILNVSDIL